MLGLLYIYIGHNSRDQVCSIGGDLCWLFHLYLLSSFVYPLFLDIEVIIEGLYNYIALHIHYKTLLLMFRKELLTKVHNFIHLNLSISLLLGYVVFLSGVETAVANKVRCIT